jgi:hypothetical protein
MSRPKIALLWRGDRSVPTPLVANTRLAPVFAALEAAGAEPQAVVYSEFFDAEVKDTLLSLDGALVWVDPLSDGRDRSRLDAILRDVAAKGVWVSAHPDVILKMGTKEVLYRTRHLGWGCDTHLYRTMEQFRSEFPPHLNERGVRVLKQYRGNGGQGVWKVTVQDGDRVSIVQGRRGSEPETLRLKDFLARCEIYFTGAGRLIDQAYQPRIGEGMIRCYSSQGEVVGFARQSHDESDSVRFGLPAAKTMFPPDVPDLATLRRNMEQDWIPGLQRLLDIPTASLPAIWDADFLLGPKTSDGADTYVLCEINISCVTPFPPEAPGKIASMVAARFR